MRSVFAIVVALAGLAVSPVSALCPEEAWRPAGEEEDGIGGSGLVTGEGGDEEDGIGGSGIARGTLTHFGSLCLNGLTIAYEDSVALEIEGVAHSVDALARGQVLEVVFETRDDGRLFAREIEVQYEAVGRLEARDDQGLRVVGQRVEILPNAFGDALEAVPGQRVAVSGLRRPDGSIAASRIDAVPGTMEDSLRAKLEATGSDLFVGGLEVLGSVASGAMPGQRVIARGRFEEGGFAAREIVRESLRIEAPAALLLEGYVEERSAMSLRVGGAWLEASGLPPEALPPAGTRVRIRARWQQGAGARLVDIERVPARRLLTPRDHGRLRSPRARVSVGAGPPSETPGARPRPPRPERAERPTQAERPDRPDRPERPERVDRPERPIRPDLRDLLRLRRRPR